jgi:hypothetical protein
MNHQLNTATSEAALNAGQNDSGAKFVLDPGSSNANPGGRGVPFGLDSAIEAAAKQRLNTVEAAVYLQLGRSTLEKKRISGDGPRFLKLGCGKQARVSYEVGDLDEWLESTKRRSTSEVAA